MFLSRLNETSKALSVIMHESTTRQEKLKKGCTRCHVNSFCCCCGSFHYINSRLFAHDNDDGRFKRTVIFMHIFLFERITQIVDCMRNDSVVVSMDVKVAYFMYLFLKMAWNVVWDLVSNFLSSSPENEHHSCTCFTWVHIRASLTLVWWQALPLEILVILQERCSSSFI